MVFQNIENKNTNVWKPLEDGDTIEGKYIGMEKSKNTNSLIYKIRELFENNEIKAEPTIFFGSQLLDELMTNVTIGDIIRITFLHWAVSGNGRRYKQWKVEVDKPEEIKVK